MRRLYQKIYLTIIASLLLVVLAAGVIWRFGASQPPFDHGLEIAGEIAATILPAADAPPAAQQAAIARLAERLKVDLALFDASLRPIAMAGRPLPPPRGRMVGWSAGPGGPAWSVQLPDQRWLVARMKPRLRHPAIGLVLFLGSIALAVAIGAYPVVRGLTRRLERLQAGVETLGSGNLAARVKVQGRDEVARLADSFNRSAAHIEDLVNAHRLLLANASHELRTPLSRIRLGIELFQQKQDPKYKADLERDIAELDALVDEILLASRLDIARSLQITEDVDLLALVAEEAARYDQCSVEGEAIVIRGDSRLLGRLIRNLLENASRHGKPPMRVEVRRDRNRAVLDVMDGGQGIPPDEREKVFTPFFRLGDGKGTGLGLSLARQIARLHGGDIAVAARPDAQSCLHVSLPA